MKDQIEQLLPQKAMVCPNHRCPKADGTESYSVILPDGHALDCGSDEFAAVRAIRLANVINSSDPAQFTRSALRDAAEALADG